MDIETIRARFQGAGFTREIRIARKRISISKVYIYIYISTGEKETRYSARILRDFAFLSRSASVEFRLSLTEYEIPHAMCASPAPPPFPSLTLSNERRLLKPEDLSNSCPVHLPPCPFPHPVSTSVINSVSDVINVRCLMIVIL